ncbi:hydroxymethylglutaryl-CoA lyase [Pandoraea anhela]|uniref:Hydroxymethylglutaryl-CoA lyase n=1 Tax=Pandoraea anhela TaxID=2508295 RepID=A0A5E4WDM8_9BURK|nr:hydroxymethylglutaryl-CoA lyase [Pandoraea anhela]VVE22501.1 hydroxymethylglutaryl-CoA lyase [Pandoraea anhela]
MSHTPRQVHIQEVSPRDGLQNECRFVDTDAKVAMVDALSECGFSKIEVTSFTSPRAIPALRDAEAVMHRIKRNPNVVYTALVPNMRGALRAMECQIDEINVVMSVSESHNRANLRMSREESFVQLRDVISAVKSTTSRINVSLSTVFGCPMEGDIEEDDVFAWVEKFHALGVDGITLCDTTGMAYPRQVGRIATRAIALTSEIDLTFHFHNTRGIALANTLVALDAGVTRFDACLGGIGGCPYAPGATGNVCTEDLVHMLEVNGIDTGVDLASVLNVSRRLPEMIGHDVPSHLLKAGHRLTKATQAATQD